MASMRAAYDDVAVVYHQTFDPEGARPRDPILEDLVGNVQGQQVLTLACGQGRDARWLADLGADVVGVDISERLLAYARQLEQVSPRAIRYVQGDAQDLAAFESASFDGVVCHMALMDIPGLAPTVGAVARVLRPGGYFVLSVVHPCYRPHVDAVDDYLADGPYEKVDGPDWLPPHAYHRSLSTYVNALSSAGMSIAKMVEPSDEPPAGRGVPNLLYLRCIAATA
ncbi:class I SAM-dependent methyltransferase [Actinopolymorpha alba]|uniref:class I SAM-dependent methyltransferase n=1 Tax=Actinopolymorpha alba TaxID=533267 RepID=UPI000367D8AC|nr:class I SAM-dependent methyltransferase [Actinopolymorpha alba]